MKPLAILSILTFLALRTPAIGLEADVRDRLDAEFLSLSDEFFEGDEARVADFVRRGIEADYGPAWFVQAARQFLHPEGSFDELKTAVIGLLDHGIDSGGPLLSFVVTKSDNHSAEDIATAERALKGIENASIDGEAYSFYFFLDITTAFPQIDPDRMRYSRFMERQYVPAVARGSMLAIVFGLNAAKPSSRSAQYLCAILRTIDSNDYRLCKDAREAANGSLADIDGENLKRNAAILMSSLSSRFGHSVELYEQAVCSSLPPGEYYNVVCTDYLAAVLSFCSLRSSQSQYAKVNNTLVCRKSDVEEFVRITQETGHSGLNKEIGKD